MLVLGRHLGERVIIDGGRIVITVVEISPWRVRLGIEAPPEISVNREEVQAAVDRKRRAAAGPDDPTPLPRPADDRPGEPEPDPDLKGPPEDMVLSASEADRLYRETFGGGRRCPRCGGPMLYSRMNSYKCFHPRCSS